MLERTELFKATEAQNETDTGRQTERHGQWAMGRAVYSEWIGDDGREVGGVGWGGEGRKKWIYGNLCVVGGSLDGLVGAVYWANDYRFTNCGVQQCVDERARRQSGHSADGLASASLSRPGRSIPCDAKLTSHMSQDGAEHPPPKKRHNTTRLLLQCNKCKKNLIV